jgi:hypothetical protein
MFAMLNASTNPSTNMARALEISMPAPLIRSSGLIIRRITKPHEQLATDLLVRRMYAWRGYLVKRQFSALTDPDHATVAAWQNGELVATLTLARDNGNNLLCETLYPKEIAELRASNPKICEYSRLATDPEFSSPEILECFFRTAYNFARSHFGATDAVVEINPRHRRYYEKELGFSRVGERRVCPRVDAPAILLHRDLRHQLPGQLSIEQAA